MSTHAESVLSQETIKIKTDISNKCTSLRCLKQQGPTWLRPHSRKIYTITVYVRAHIVQMVHVVVRSRCSGGRAKVALRRVPVDLLNFKSVLDYNYRLRESLGYYRRA